MSFTDSYDSFHGMRAGKVNASLPLFFLTSAQIRAARSSYSLDRGGSCRCVGTKRCHHSPRGANGEPDGTDKRPMTWLSAARWSARARRIVANQSSPSNGGKGSQLLIAYELVIKPILVRVCGGRYLAMNYNNSLSLWNFDEYFLKSRVRTSARMS
jgi:hypothetical protein